MTDKQTHPCFYILICSIVFALINIGSIVANDDNSGDKYAIIVDAGSTGSRIFTFKFSATTNGDRLVESINSKKLMPGLSSFAENPKDAIDYLMPALMNSFQSIPPKSDVECYVKGTAGMRLLSDDQQVKLWDTLYNSFKFSNIPCKFDRESFVTIDGYFEAYYAVLASNYVAGSIDGNLHRIDGKEMVGAIDMGGSSTQLIFHTDTKPGEPVRDSDFWSNSWLNFGVERVRERVWEYLIDSSVNPSDATVIIDNPCTFVGFEETYIMNDKSYRMRGSGHGKDCVVAIKNVLWPNGNCLTTPCFIDGVEHPPINGTFYGMSVYFYALDCIRHHGPIELKYW